MEKEDMPYYRANKAYNTLWIARDLGYPDEVIQQIKKAKTEAEITRIMTTARHQMKEGQ